MNIKKHKTQKYKKPGGKSQFFARSLVKQEQIVGEIEKVEKIGKKTFKADNWQQAGIDTLKEHHSLFVHAPTSAGKTFIAESYMKFIFSNLKEKTRIYYTTPVKSLSNDKYIEFSELFGSENIGISTGDVKINIDAPIVIMTQEILFQILSDHEESRKPDLVVIDEWQFIADDERGRNWEFAFILICRMNIQFLAMTATVENQKEFQDWLQSLSVRPIEVIQQKKRPVPIKDVFFKEGNAYEIQTFDDILKYFPRGEQQLTNTLLTILELKLYPTILFVGTRGSSAQNFLLVSKNLPKLEEDESNLLKQHIRNENIDLGRVRLELRNAVIKKGVACYHAGLSYQEKIFVESLAKKRLLRFLVSTSAICVGVNFAMRSGIFLDSERGSRSGKERFSDIEIKQMLGRVGRRGYDQFGFNIVIGEPFFLHNEYYSTVLKPIPTFDLYSILCIYNIVGCSLSKTRHFALNSFYAWKHGSLTPITSSGSRSRKKKKRGNDQKYDDLILPKIKELKRLGFITPEGEITAKGNLALNFGNKMGMAVALYAENRDFDLHLLSGLGVNARQFTGDPVRNRNRTLLGYLGKAFKQDYPSDFSIAMVKNVIKKYNSRGRWSKQALNKKIEYYQFFNKNTLDVINFALKANNLQEISLRFSDRWLDSGDLEKIIINYIQVLKNLNNFLLEIKKGDYVELVGLKNVNNEDVTWEIDILTALFKTSIQQNSS